MTSGLPSEPEEPSPSETLSPEGAEPAPEAPSTEEPTAESAPEGIQVRSPYLGPVLLLVSITLLTWFLATGIAVLALNPRRNVFLLLLSQLVGQAVGVGMAMNALRVAYQTGLLTDRELGIRFTGDTLEAVERGLRLYLLSLPGLFLLSFLVSALSRRYHFVVDRPQLVQLLQQVRTHPASLVLALLMVSVGAPLFEEMVFRGLLYSAMRLRWGVFTALIVTSFLFAFLHQPMMVFSDLRSFPLPILYLGFVLGLIRERTDSVAPGMAVHALNNAVVLLMTLLVKPAG